MALKKIAHKKTYYLMTIMKMSPSKKVRLMKKSATLPTFLPITLLLRI